MKKKITIVQTLMKNCGTVTVGDHVIIMKENR